jgi:isocitrate/isopropylmalate dehydrogenase
MVDEAVRECIANGDSTGDLGGKLNTAEFTAAVIKRMGPK